MTAGPSTLAAVRRAEQVYYEQIAQRQTLDYGVAFFAPEHPAAEGDNAFREVLIEAASSLAPAWEQVEQFYQGRGLVCRRWVPSSEQSMELLADFLAGKGFNRRALAAMVLTGWPHPAVNREVRVLPARAMRKAFRQLQSSPASADLAERRIDYAQLDAFVATSGGQPAGRCALLQAGEIGYICDLYVAGSFRRQGVASTLLAEVLAMARRLMMKTVCLKVEAGNQAALGLLESLHFEQDGELMEFDRTGGPGGPAGSQ